MKSATIRVWGWVHKWSSLVCTVFLLMLCITGLPLIFEDEIDALLNPDDWQPAAPEASHLSHDEVLAIALAARPGEVPLFMSFDTDRPVVNVTTGPRADAPGSAMHFASFDLTSGDVVPQPQVGATLMEFLLQLHTDLFLGLFGMLFLGAMGLMFIVAVVSGIVLYAPFMRQLDFATVRTTRSRRATWLDIHNLTGIATAGWLLVVVLAGVVNTLETPITDAWRNRALAELVALNSEATDAEGHTDTAQRASLSEAIDNAVALAPDQELQFVAFPGGSFSSATHYAVFLHGNTPLTERLITPVLIDAATGRVDGLQTMPWANQALSLSRPLHFGDYGGLPLKVVWALLDFIAIVILISGLKLWRNKKPLKQPPRTDDYPCQSRHRPRARRSLMQVFRAPLALGVASVAGILAALVLDGGADGLASLALSSGVVASVYGLTNRQR